MRRVTQGAQRESEEKIGELASARFACRLSSVASVSAPLRSDPSSPRHSHNLSPPPAPAHDDIHSVLQAELRERSRINIGTMTRIDIIGA